MTCEVCDRKGPLELFHRYRIHRKCAPSYWGSDQDDQTEFTERFRVWWANAPEWKKKRDH